MDSLTYGISALVMMKVNGSFLVTTATDNNINGENITDQPNEGEKNKFCNAIDSTMSSIINGIKSFCIMSKDFILYLLSSGFALCAFMKASGSLTWGAQDILYVDFTFVKDDESESSTRLGIIYSCAGLGCLIGPFLSNLFVRGDKPHTIQLACICAFIFIIIGYMGTAIAPNFLTICLFTGIRGLGDSIIFMNATLLLTVSL